MDNSISYKYEEIINNISSFDKTDTQIILSDANTIESVAELDYLFQLFKNAEISFLIDLNYNLAPEFIRFCKLHRIIIYMNNDAIQNVNLFDKIISFEVDKVLNIDISKPLLDDTIKKIIDGDINVCFINNNMDLEQAVVKYNQLINKGFCRIASIVNVYGGHPIKGTLSGFINRSMIERFNMDQNMSILGEINKLKQNALKRNNRYVNLKENTICDVLFVNVNVNLLMQYERKNLGIEYLASVLNRDGIKADCIYCSQISVIEKLEEAISLRKVKVIGMSCMQDNVIVIEHVSRYLKRKYPDISIFVGGAQAVGLYEDFLKSSGVDYIMVGESEKNITSLILHMLNGSPDTNEINGIRYFDNDGYYRENVSGDLIENLDEIPFPNYVYKNDDNLIIAGIITGRGCPFNCAFCYEGAKEKKVRYRSLDNVFEEISLLLKNNKNVKMLQIYDDTFTLDEKRVLDFCNRFRKIRNLHNVSWICEIHCQTVYNKPDLIRYMVESGLEQAQIGIESGNGEVLKKYNKKITPEMIEMTVDHCNKAGLNLLEGNILLGGAGETKEQIEENTEFVKKLLLIGAGMLQVYPVMYWPFVKTPIASSPENYGVKIIPEQMDYTIHCIDNCVTESDTVKRQEFVDYSDYLRCQIKDTYKKIALKFTADQVGRLWKNGNFIPISQWAMALSDCKYMRNYFLAKDRGAVNIFEDGVFIMRTFNFLSYKNNQLYIKDSDLLLSERDSRILELCNGKNTIDDIKEKLHLNKDEIIHRLTELDKRMLVYGVLC